MSGDKYIRMYLYLHARGGDVEEREEVLDQSLLLREKPAANLRLTQTNQHREKLEAVRIGRQAPLCLGGLHGAALSGQLRGRAS